MDHLRALPEREGYTTEHVHEKGEACVIGGFPAPACRYVPTLLTRLRWKLAAVFS